MIFLFKNINKDNTIVDIIVFKYSYFKFGKFFRIISILFLLVLFYFAYKYEYIKNEIYKILKSLPLDQQKLIFAGKYLTNIEVNDLEKNAEEAKNNNDLSEYYLKLVREIKDKNNKDIYSNENFMNSFQKITSSPETALYCYKNDFFEIKEVL